MFSTSSESCRGRQLHHIAIAMHPRQHLRQPRHALPGADKATPVGDGDFDRRQCTAHHDRGGDHGAGGQFLLNHQIGTEAIDAPTASSGGRHARRHYANRRRRTDAATHANAADWPPPNAPTAFRSCPWQSPICCCGAMPRQVPNAASPPATRHAWDGGSRAPSAVSMKTGSPPPPARQIRARDGSKSTGRGKSAPTAGPPRRSGRGW